MTEPKKNSPGQGRKPSGRVRVMIQIDPVALARIDQMKRDSADSRGKAIERLLPKRKKETE